MIQIPLVKYDLNNKSFTGKTSVNKANLKGTQREICFGQVFSAKNSINFTGEPINTSRLDKALQYIKNVTEYNRQFDKGKLLHISNLDPRQMEGILDGIDAFKGMTVYDLYLLDNLNSLALQRGCKNQCSHCMFCAKAPSKTISWENIEKFVDGLAELKQRLGFKPIFIKRDFLIPYLDSDPIALQSKDKNGKTHNIAEVQELVYDKTKERFDILTAGWDLEQTDCKKAAQDLVDLIKRKPESLRCLEISFHPFHKWMTKSIKSPDPEKSKEYRKKYIDRMTDVVITFLPLLKLEKAAIRVEYMPNLQNDSPLSEEAARKLALELVDNVMKVCEERNMPKDEYMFLEENINKYSSMECISDKGRAKRLFHTDKELKTINRVDNSDDELKLLIDDFVDFDEIIGTLYNNYNYPVINKYIFNINLDKHDDLINNSNKIGKLVDNLIEIRKLFLDHKMVLNIQTNDDQNQSKFLSEFKTLVEQYCGPKYTDVSNSIINSIKINSIDLSKFDKEINHFTDLYNLIPDNNNNKKEFTRAIGLLSTGQTKALNTDGSVLILQKEEEGDLNKNTYTIKGLKFNFENDDEQIKKQTPLQELNFDTKSYIVSQIPRTVIERDKKYNLTGDDQNIRTISFGRKLERWA